MKATGAGAWQRGRRKWETGMWEKRVSRREGSIASSDMEIHEEKK